MSQPVTDRGELPAPPADDLLESWKGIAAYLSRDERTVRRWEKREGLPVHRHVHQKQATVYAYRSELEAWRRTRGIGTQALEPASFSRVHFDWFRMSMGAVLWFVAYNILVGATWSVLLHRAGISSFHPLLGRSSVPDLAHVGAFVALTFAMGLSGMCFYAILCSRYGARPPTAIYAGLALWWLWGLLPNLPGIFLGTLPRWPLVWELTAKLLVMVSATLAGASVYRAPAPSSNGAGDPGKIAPPRANNSM